MTASSQQIQQLHRAAQSALQQGQLREAHQHCLAILKQDQTHADAWFLCGVIAAHNGQLAKSVDIFRKAIELAPEQAEYRAELGKQLIALRQPEQALHQANQALALAPTQLPVLNTLGTVFSHLGEHKKALQCFENAAGGLQQTSKTRQPAAWQAELFFNMAASRQFSGDFAGAGEAYEAAIQLQPKMFKAHSALSQLQGQTTEHNHLPRLQGLRDSVSSAQDQLHLGHAIAKEQEDLGHYQAALASLEWAKQAQAGQVAYRAETDARMFQTLRQLFSADRLQSEGGCDNPEPVFIVGMPRSGTTLVEQIVAAHSRVYAAGELQNFPLSVKRLTGSPSSEVLDMETLARSIELDMAELGASYINSTRPRTGHTPYFIDKLPLNFMYAGLIKLALPRAKIICLRRDPMDTCLSNYRQLFATNFKYYYYAYDLLDCGRYYIEFDRLIQHWQKVMPGAIHEVHYEALVEKPEQVSRELLAYCDLPWEEQCLQFHQRQTSVATASAVQVRSDIYQSSVNRWQRYGQAMQPLYELLKAAGLYQ